MDKRYPEPVVGAFIINNEGKIFLMKSKKWSDKYVIPGGHIEIGETIEEALHREIKEETNLDIENPEFICLWEFIDGKEFYDKRHMLFLNYLVKSTSSEVSLNDEGQEYVWVTKIEAMELPLESYTKMTLEKYSTKIFK